MPKELHRKLVHEAEKKGYTGEQKRRYVYGTMQKIKMAEQKKGPKKA